MIRWRKPIRRNNSTRTVERTTEFHSFPKLPLELRSMIWNKAIYSWGPDLIEVGRLENIKVAPFELVNKEARTAWLALSVPVHFKSGIRRTLPTSLFWVRRRKCIDTFLSWEEDHNLLPNLAISGLFAPERGTLPTNVPDRFFDRFQRYDEVKIVYDCLPENEDECQYGLIPSPSVSSSVQAEGTDSELDFEEQEQNLIDERRYESITQNCSKYHVEFVSSGKLAVSWPIYHIRREDRDIEVQAATSAESVMTGNDQ